MTGLSSIERAMVESIALQPALDRALAWATINSGTGNLAGLDRMAALLADAFAMLPGEVTLRDPAPVERIGANGKPATVAHGRHLVAQVRPGAERRVLLTGHMDTVFPADHAFQTCTWLNENRVNGPGTADMKGGLSLMLAALEAFEASGPRLGYDVLINSDEETGSQSSAPLIADLARGKLAALTYEPAMPGGEMARARPGSGNFAAVVTGRAAHAGRNPQDGRNAVAAAGDLASRLAQAGRAGLSINPARIEGGGPNNMVPALAVLHFNIRPAGETELAGARAAMDQAIAEVCRRHDVHIHLHGAFNRPPKPISEHTRRLFALVQGAAAALDETLSWRDTGGVCDGNNIAAAGIPVIDTMGACGGAIHSPDEFLDVDSLRTRARLSALTLHRLDRGELAP